MIEPTQKEAGCLQYNLHQDQQHPEIFIFYGNWESREHWQTHMNNDHLKMYREETDGAVHTFTLNEMSMIV